MRIAEIDICLKETKAKHRKGLTYWYSVTYVTSKFSLIFWHAFLHNNVFLGYI